MRAEFDNTSLCMIGGPFTNTEPFDTVQDVLAFLNSLGPVDDFPKSAFWGAIVCLGVRTNLCPVFCIPTPLRQGVTSEFLRTFFGDVTAMAIESGSDCICLSSDGCPKFRALAKKFLKKGNYPEGDGLGWIEIDHPDSRYFALKLDSNSLKPRVLTMVNDCEHILKLLRNAHTGKHLIIGDRIINMILLEEIRLDHELQKMHKLSVTDTNIEVSDFT